VDLTGVRRVCVNKRLPSLERRADVGLGRDNARRDVLWSGPADPSHVCGRRSLVGDPDDLGPTESTPQWAAYKFAQA
jgi:hypothetical protein